MLRMVIEGVGFDHLHQTVVVLKDWEGRKLLPIWIGPSEAKSIAIEMEGAAPGRPLPHDLVLSAVALAEGKITRVVINDLQDSTFFATIDIDTPRGMQHMDARPSDAIAIAVRAKCPVFVDGTVEDALIEMNDVVTTTAGSEPPANQENAPTTATEQHPAPRQSDDEIARFRRLLGDLGQ